MKGEEFVSVLDDTKLGKLALLYDGDKDRDASSKIRGYLFQDYVAIDCLLKEDVVYVGDAGENKPWKKYVRRLRGIKDANSEVFLLKDLLENVVPKDHVPANHTWKFTDELPTEGDTASIVYVTFGSQYDSDSRLEYDPDDNVYIRYMSVKKSVDMPYRETTLIGAENVDDKLSDGRIARRVAYEDRVPGNTITFSNVIVQGITMKWRGGARPDPVLTGRGNADYFMGGKHSRIFEWYGC